MRGHVLCVWSMVGREVKGGGGAGVESAQQPDNQASKMRERNSMQTNVFHTITRLIILIPLQCHGDSEKERKGERWWERERFSETGTETRERGGGRGGRRREGEREHIRLRDLQWLYIFQCLVKAARQGSGNLIIA